jgi:hypothetical protein
MQPARRADDIHPRPQVEVIRIAQNDLRPHLQQFTRIDGLHARLRPHRHKNRRLNDTMRRGQSSQPRLRRRIIL